MRLVFEVPREWAGHKLKNFIRSRGLSAKMWKRIKWQGVVMLNGEAVHNANEILPIGSQVICEWEESLDIVPADIPLSIIYEDDYLLAVNKYDHMLIHPTQIGVYDTLVNALAGYYEKNHIHGGIHPVYRLDRNTTGIVLIAKEAWVKYALAKRHDLIFREYIAVVSGHLDVTQGCINEPIGRKDGSIVEHVVRADGKPAETEFSVIGYGDNYTVVRLHLLTGRTHQIRVHMAYLGHPLLGDTLYGGNDKIIKRQALHAESASFIHPVSEKEFSFTAPIPDDMKYFMEGLKKWI